MALVKCPECGREKVSDCAESCPECGYNIKAYFENIKIEEQKRIAEEQKKRNEEIRSQNEKAENEKKIVCPECKEEFLAKLKVCPHCGLSMEDKENLKRLRNIEYLEMRIKSKEWLKTLGGMMGFLVFSIIFFILDSIMLGLVFGVLAFITLIGMIIESEKKDKLKDDLKLAKKDYEAYKLQQQKEYKKMMDSVYADNIKKSLQHPQCPNCGSTNTVKISTANRMVSIAAVGVASSKIGKQYECKKCKHKW